MNLEFSRRLALFGVIPFIADTIRRWHQLGDIKIWPFWLDDFWRNPDRANIYRYCIGNWRCDFEYFLQQKTSRNCG